MGIYYKNHLYYGFLLSKKTVDICKLTNNLKLMKISDDRFLLYSKIDNIDDGVPSLNLVPYIFSASKLKVLNPHLDDNFFTDNLFVEELRESISKLKVYPRFYVCCSNLYTLSERQSYNNLIYNIRVDINT